MNDDYELTFTNPDEALVEGKMVVVVGLQLVYYIW